MVETVIKHSWCTLVDRQFSVGYHGGPTPRCYPSTHHFHRFPAGKMLWKYTCRGSRLNSTN